MSGAELYLKMQILLCISPSCCSLNPEKCCPIPKDSVIPPGLLLAQRCHQCHLKWIWGDSHSPSQVGEPQCFDQDQSHLFPSAPVRSGQTCRYRPRASELNNVRTSQEVVRKTSFMPKALSLRDMRETSADPRSSRKAPFHRHQSPGK